MTQVRSKRADTAIKALDDNRVGGYLVVWGDAKQKDLEGEYFTPNTNFELDWYAQRPALYHHGLDGTVSTKSVGAITALKADDVGLWAEAQLNIRDAYEQAIMGMVKAGKLGWSSGSLSHLVEVEDDGQIKRWPIVEGSLTPSPAEPRNTDIRAIKSAYDALGLDTTLLGLQSADDAQNPREANEPIEGVRASEGGVKAGEPKHAATTKTTSKSEEGLLTMMNDEYKSELRTVLKEVLSEMMSAGGEMESEDMAKMEEDLQAKAEAAIDEEVKMEDPEAGKSVDVVGIVLGELPAALDRAMQRRDERKSRVKAALTSALPSESRVKGGFNGGRANITNVEDLRFAHLDADDMALGLKMVSAANRGMPLKQMVDYGRISEDYLRALAVKASDFANSNPFGNDRIGNATIKSTLPIKANELLASDIATQGDEWVGEFWSTTLWRKERFETLYDKFVSKGAMVQELGQGTETGYFPTEGADPVAYRRDQADSVDATGRPENTVNINAFNTSRIAITPAELALATGFTTIMEEDSLIPVAAQVNRQMRETMLEYRDRLLINGDIETSTTNVNYDGGTPATGTAQPYYLVSDGLRKLPLVTHTAGSRSASGSLTLEDYRATLALMDATLRQYKDRLMFIIDPDTEMASLALTELATDDVRRTNATITSGVLDNLYGVEVATNGFLPLTASDGKVTYNAAGTLGSILLAYPRYWAIAYKRQIKLETQYDVLSGTTVYVMSTRIGIKPRGTNAAVMTYNVGVS